MSSFCLTQQEAYSYIKLLLKERSTQVWEEKGFKPQLCIQAHTSATKQRELSSSQNAQKIFEHKLIFKLPFFSFSAIHLTLNNAEKKLAVKTDTGTISKHVAYVYTLL